MEKGGRERDFGRDMTLEVTHWKLKWKYACADDSVAKVTLRTLFQLHPCARLNYRYIISFELVQPPSKNLFSKIVESAFLEKCPRYWPSNLSQKLVSWTAKLIERNKTLQKIFNFPRKLLHLQGATNYSVWEKNNWVAKFVKFIASCKHKRSKTAGAVTAFLTQQNHCCDNCAMKLILQFLSSLKEFQASVVGYAVLNSWQAFLTWNRLSRHWATFMANEVDTHLHWVFLGTLNDYLLKRRMSSKFAKYISSRYFYISGMSISYNTESEQFKCGGATHSLDAKNFSVQGMRGASSLKLLTFSVIYI